MFRKAWIAAPVAAIVLGGCASMDHMMQHYANTPVQEFRNHHDNFRIFDKPADGRVMITSSIESAAAQGLVGGLTFNPALAAPPKPIYEQAVAQYLAASGRQCTISDGYLLVQPQWEFRYTCAAASAQSAPPAAATKGAT